MSFINLHLHSEYSMLDGVQKVPSFLNKAKELGMNSIALTDHGSMYGLYDFWKGSHEFEIKPIIGCEMYIASSSRFDKTPGTQKTFHLPILAKNKEGYFNLVKLVSMGHLEGFYYKPRVDRELIEKYKENLIVLSGSQFGELRFHIELGNIDKAKETVEFYKKNFGDNYFIELTPDLKEVEKYHRHLEILKKFAKEFDIKMVASANSYYLNKEDVIAQEVVWALSDGKKLTDPSRRKSQYSQHFRTEDEMMEAWKDMPEVVELTQQIADQIEDYKIGHGKVEPEYIDLPKGFTPKEYIKKLSYEGAQKIFINDNQKELAEHVITRLEYELDLIDKKGYNDYFLVVMEYVQWANNQGIPTSCRGSGASSLVAYCIGITPLDPLRWKLPFERLLNPERESFPDFDIDFADDKRDLLFVHMAEKYGFERTSNICAVGRMKSRAVLKDVGRVIDVPLTLTEKLSKLVTVKFGKPAKLKEMMDPEKHPEFVEIVKGNSELEELINVSSIVEDNARHISTHACGFVYVPKNVIEYLPIQKETRGDKRVITQIEGKYLEYLGLMKFDFLGVANLTSIAIAVDLIEKRHGVKLKMREIPEDDKKTFALLQKADTAGVFQLESDGMRKYLRDLKPTVVEDISFMCAAYRPGPMMFIEPYIKRKHGKEEVTYPHESLISVLEETYGYAIYQEQVMQIAQIFAGYTLGAADMLRRAMGKKDHKVMEGEKAKFIEGSIKMNHTEPEAEKIFSYLAPFADYGFNKAHSAAYAMIAYQTAYLKANYTIEFIAALMQADIEKPDKLIRDIEEAKSHGIEVLAPDVNRSNEDFTIIDDKTILFGLAGLKGVGRGQVTEIVEKRKEVGRFTSLAHFLETIDLGKVSKSALELLSKVGAMEGFGNRAQILEIISSSIEKAHKSLKNKLSGQYDLFGSSDGSAAKLELEIPDISEVTDLQKITWEKDILGIFLSEHPLIKYQDTLKKQGVVYSDELPKKRGRSKTKIVGIISSIREIRTKKDGKLMCFGKLEDPFGVIPITVFPRTYETAKNKMQNGALVLITGSIDKSNEIVGVLVDEVRVIDETKFTADVTKHVEEVDKILEKEERQEEMQEEIHEEIHEERQKDTKNISAPIITNISSVELPTPLKIDSTNLPVIQEIKKTISKIILHLDASTEVDKLKNLSSFFKDCEGTTNLELLLSNDKKVVLKNGIRYDDTFKEKILNLVPNTRIEEIS